MKKFVVLFLCAVIISVCCVPVGAHSGRTDSSGGHYDHSTGKYHYHHGYSAHQHENGRCPYNSSVGDSSEGDSQGFLGLDGWTFFGCLLAFTFIFSMLTFKLDLGFFLPSLLSASDSEEGCLLTIGNILVALIFAFLAIVIIRIFII